MPPDDTSTRRLWRHAFHTLLVLVLVFSLLPPSTPMPSTGWDKSNHLPGFAVLGWLGMKAHPDQGVRVFAGLLAYGALVEVLQSFTPYRFAEWGDLLADGLGALLGAAIAWLPARLRSSVKR